MFWGQFGLKRLFNKVHIGLFPFLQNDFHHVVSPGNLPPPVLRLVKSPLPPQKTQPLRRTSNDQGLLLGIHRPERAPEITSRPGFHLHKNEKIEILPPSHHQIDLPAFGSPEIPIENLPSETLEMPRRNPLSDFANLPRLKIRQAEGRAEQRAETSDGGADTGHTVRELPNALLSHILYDDQNHTQDRSLRPLS